MFDFITAEFICLIAGPVIAIAVSAMKRLSFVAAHPKIVAAILSIIIGLTNTLTAGGLDWPMLAECILIPFAAAVATYEVAKSATNNDSPRTL